MERIRNNHTGMIMDNIGLINDNTGKIADNYITEDDTVNGRRK
ncbi:hypothetical protein [Nitrosopumilus sp.]|nr:hypothetical protein [Nitrosopumilus sp.]